MKAASRPERLLRNYLAGLLSAHGPVPENQESIAPSSPSSDISGPTLRLTGRAQLKKGGESP
jgi:hypothetical protein